MLVCVVVSGAGCEILNPPPRGYHETWYWYESPSCAVRMGEGVSQSVLNAVEQEERYAAEEEAANPEILGGAGVWQVLGAGDAGGLWLDLGYSVTPHYNQTRDTIVFAGWKFKGLSDDSPGPKKVVYRVINNESVSRALFSAERVRLVPVPWEEYPSSGGVGEVITVNFIRTSK